MRVLLPCVTGAALGVVLILGVGVGSPAPAQTRRVIHMAMSSFKFEPSIFSVNEGDTVVLQFENIDPQRSHSFDSPYLSQVDFAVAGQYKQGARSDGTKYVLLDPGQKAEMTFTAKGRGQYAFICGVFNHAARGETGAFVVWPAGYHTAPK